MSINCYLDLETGELLQSHREAVEHYRLKHRIALLDEAGNIVLYWDT